jgi:class 3 adenylate cyclase
VLLFLILKDIIDLTKILRTRDRSKIDRLRAHSQEAETLLGVASEFESMTTGLKAAKRTYADSLSPAIRFELEQGLVPSTVFHCAVVRVDVNGYTQMVLERRPEFVSTVLNQYFKAANEIIARYRGHVYQYVGDEIVFHFKADGGNDPLPMALAAVRSLFEAAHEIDRGLKPERIPFIVKASIACGPLRFIALDSGYAFSGVPLIESVRMLGKIEERENNILALYANDFSRVADLAFEYQRRNVEFKGFQSQTSIVEIKDFVPVKHWLEQSDFKRLQFYRADADSAETLNHIERNLDNLSRENFSTLYHNLRQSVHGEAQAALKESFLRVFLKTNEWAKSPAPNGAVFLASLTKLGAQILKPQDLTASIRQLLEANLQHHEQRVRANTVEALDHLAPGKFDFRVMISEPFNRVAADALIAVGKQEYTHQVHRQLKGFMQSKDPKFVASGLYVAAHLYIHHYQTDPVYFRANRQFLEIPAWISEHLQNPSEMVRIRAERSMKMVTEIDVGAQPGRRHAS